MKTKIFILLFGVVFPLWGFSQKKDTIVQYSYCVDGIRVSFDLPWHYLESHKPDEPYRYHVRHHFGGCDCIRYKSHIFFSIKRACSMFSIMVNIMDSESHPGIFLDQDILDTYKEFCPSPIYPTIKRMNDSNSIRVLSYGSTIFDLKEEDSLEPSQRHPVFSVYQYAVLLRNELYFFELRSHDKISEYSAEEKMRIMNSIKVEYVGENP